MYILGMIILVFFAVIGIAVFIGMIIKANAKCDTDGFVLLIPSVSADNAEARIRSADAICRDIRGCRIVCVCKKDGDARFICEKMQEMIPYLSLADRIEVIR